MKNLRYIALHAAGAFAFMYLLQRFVMKAGEAESLLWGLAFALAAAALAWRQSTR